MPLNNTSWTAVAELRTEMARAAACASYWWPLAVAVHSVTGAAELQCHHRVGLFERCLECLARALAGDLDVHDVAVLSMQRDSQ